MESPDFIITYDGFGVSELFFCPGEVDLARWFCPGGGPGSVFVTDQSVAALPALGSFCGRFGGTVRRGVGIAGNDLLVVLPPGEAHKTIDSVTAILRAALEHDLPRRTRFCGIGGGVVCDMTAFAASVYKRGGGALELVPTTLLAMADAAVGGKAGCDLGPYKNMVGSFYPARRIRFFPAFLRTLPEAEYRSGLAEILKTALLFDSALFEDFKHRRASLLHPAEGDFEGTILPIVQRCVEAKARVVERDLRETGERMLLNYGHTFAHALETVAGLGTVPHGDAVAWGMARAVTLSARLGLCTDSYCGEVCALLTDYGWETGPVPAGRHGFTAEALLGAMKKDKKNSDAGTVRVILQRSLCDTVIREVADDDIRGVLK
ncbi:MAG: 3-dehydroquinate synthase [Spirochaetaceae bacterium]|jgi:3-dehydroquinate synthase|nr:3-dehydroquinate synthase [Spirochaetaceae bacterium]